METEQNGVERMFFTGLPPTKGGWYVQAVLTCGNKVQVAWIKKKTGVAVGSVVELKSTGEFWKIDRLYESISGHALSEQQAGNRQFGPSIKRGKKNH